MPFSPAQLRARLSGVIAFPCTPFKANLALDLAGLRKIAVCCLLLSLALALWLFLWEIYSPDYGFRMPWLQVENVSALLHAG